MISVPAIAARADGDFVVVWANAYDNEYASTWGLFGRRFALCGNGLLSDGTRCDDGNTTSADGCSPHCDV